MRLGLSLEIRDRAFLQVHLVLGLVNDLLLLFDALSILNDSRSLFLKVPSHLTYRLVSPTQLFQQLLVVLGLSLELDYYRLPQGLLLDDEAFKFNRHSLRLLKRVLT